MLSNANLMMPNQMNPAMFNQMNPTMTNQMNPAMLNTFFTNMQNMIGSMKPMPFDPHKIDSRLKRSWISMNISQSKSILYKQFPRHESMTFTYTGKCNPGKADNICEVSVVYEHALDVAEKY